MARQTSRKWVDAAAPTVKSIKPHAVRLFPKSKGADEYEITGVAARCDWTVLSDARPPHILVRRFCGSRPPRHIFLSLRAPYVALTNFADAILPTLSAPFVLVSGSEDATVPHQTDKRWRPYNKEERACIRRILDHPMLIHWFAENLDDDSDKRLSPLPTGFVFAEGLQTSAIAAPQTPPLRERSLNIFCAHRVRPGRQWEARRRVSDLARSEWAAWTTHCEHEISESEFLRALRQHAFVLCVEGGGIDPSPKAWTSILNGAIPIIRRSAVSTAYEELPVVIIDDWRADAICESKLRAWRERFAAAQDTIDGRLETLRRLSADYWWSKIEAYARR